MTHKKNDESGFSLIEVLIALAIMFVVSLGITQIMAAQSREVKSLSEKLVLTDLKTRLSSVISKTDLCSCLLKTNSFNTRRLENPLTAPITYIPETYNYPLPTGNGPCNDRNVPRLVPPANTAIPGTHIRVGSIGVVNFVDMGGGAYLGEIEIKLQGDSLVRQLKPVTVPFMVNVNTTTGTDRNRPVDSCGPASSSGQQIKAYYEPRAIELNQNIFANRRLACAGSRVAIEFGGKFSHTNPYTGGNYDDSRGYLRLYVDNVEVADRRGGGRVGSGGDLTDAPTSVHGMWEGPCNGSVVFRSRWETEDRTAPSDRPVIEQNYLKVSFFDP